CSYNTAQSANCVTPKHEEHHRERVYRSWWVMRLLMWAVTLLLCIAAPLALVAAVLVVATIPRVPAPQIPLGPINLGVGVKLFILGAAPLLLIVSIILGLMAVTVALVAFRRRLIVGHEGLVYDMGTVTLSTTWDNVRSLDTVWMGRLQVPVLRLQRPPTLQRRMRLIGRTTVLPQDMLVLGTFGRRVDGAVRADIDRYAPRVLSNEEATASDRV
ncbi:MAG: hypothetical protein M3380_12585, partial [Chloroflexota bacterium]|nr:hypothetical protein [Chloroflexota bacterium]